MKRARKLWTAFLMTAVMTMSMGIPTVFADDVVGTETTAETTQTEFSETTETQVGEPVENQNIDEGTINNADETPASTDGDEADETPASVDDEDDGEPVTDISEVDDSLFSGTGDSDTDPYLIEDEADLRALATAVNDGESYAGKYFELTDDITLTEINFTPIGYYNSGTENNSFKGTFDGGNHTISAEDGVVIGTSGSDYQGLFGYIGEGATISNVTVSVDVVGAKYVGGVVGRAYLYDSDETIAISNCYNTGDIKGSCEVGGVVGIAYAYLDDSNGTITISDCYNTGDVTSTATSESNVGGVVGSISDSTVKVSGCYNTGAVAGAVVDAATGVVGGVVGNNDGGTVEVCYNTGDVTGGGINGVGGVVGYNSGTVTTCYNVGAVSGTGSNIGGVVGQNSGTVQYCYNIGAVTGSNIGGVVGKNSGTVTTCYYNSDTSVATSGIGDETTDVETNTKALSTFQMTGTTLTGRANTSATMAALNTDDEDAFSFQSDSVPTRYYPYLTTFGADSAASVEAFEGAGTSADPYLISNEAELRLLSTKVNEEGESYSEKFFKVTASIGLTEDFTSIGTKSNPFKGTFDGNNKNIFTSYIAGVIGTSDSDNQGLFGYVDGASISNVNISVDVVGKDNVGGVVGYATETTTISNCYNAGDVTGTGVYVGGIVGQVGTGSTVAYCDNTGDVTGNAVVGGIVGQVNTDSTVKYCYNTGLITGEKECVGGLVGTNYGTVQYSYNTGAVVGDGANLGGLIGYHNNNGADTVSSSYNVGSVTCTNSTPPTTHGGVIGGGEFSAITSCYYNNETFVDTDYSNSYGTGLTTLEMTGTGDDRASDNMVDFDTSTWTFKADNETSTVGYYPVLKDNEQDPAPSTLIALTFEDGAYQITNEDDLIVLSDFVNGGNDCVGMTFVLTADIELKNDFTSIGTGSYSFGGTFDGDFKTISTTGSIIIGINNPVTGNNYQGLFGNISSTATVQNVTVYATVSGYNYVGGVVGNNEGGTVENCHNTGTVIGGDAYVGGVVGYNNGGTVKNCSNSGTVTGDGNYVGGVVGYNSATSTATATVSDCSNSGIVTGGNNYVGGVVGNNYANKTNESAIVTNCSNSGTVTGASNYVGGVVGQNNASGSSDGYAPQVIVSECSNTGDVTGSGINIGGVVGSNSASRGTAEVSNCSNTGDVTCYENTGDDTDNSNVGGVVGYNNGVIGGTATVADCSNTGDVTGAENNVGGVVGYNIGGMDIDNSDRSGTAIVTGCSNYGDVTGDVNNVGGIVGNNFVDISGGEAIATNSKNYGAITGVNYVGGVVGLNNEGGEVTKCGSVNAVTGTGENVDVFIGGGDGTDENCYVITSGSTSYYIKAKAIGNGTVAPEGEDASPDSMYKVTKLSDVTFEFTPDDGYEVTDVIVNDVSVGVCDEYEFEDIIFTMQTLEVVFEKSSTTSDEDEDEDEDEESEEDVVEEIELPFGDVDEDDDNYDGIAYVYENGLMAGISSDVFGGDMSITRGMIAAILFRIDGSVPVNAIMPFADIPADQYYYEAVNWGKAEGVMAGVSATEFDPDAPITNEQFIAFLYRYATYLGMDMTIEWSADLTGYEMSDYAIIAIAWALENDIIDEDCVPMTTALRGDVATSLMNFMEM